VIRLKHVVQPSAILTQPCQVIVSSKRHPRAVGLTIQIKAISSRSLSLRIGPRSPRIAHNKVTRIRNRHLQIDQIIIHRDQAISSLVPRGSKVKAIKGPLVEIRHLTVHKVNHAQRVGQTKDNALTRLAQVRQDKERTVMVTKDAPMK
jgi:hypothetical protein